eukprot:3542782-Amphidinium_carterae.1
MEDQLGFAFRDLGQAGLMWRTSRLVCALVVSEPVEPTAKLSLIADQIQEVEVPVLTSAAILQCYEACESRMGAYPHADEELT